jgi:(p)ppGpp synthase/HD superfamily hydrolase
MSASGIGKEDRMSSRKDEAWYQSTLALVQERHSGKVDKLGWPYYQHFERVADRLVRLFPGATPAQVQAALLHDALEPGESSVEQLRQRGITSEAVELIDKIKLPTDGRAYLQYIRELVETGDIFAIQVKLADNLDAFEFYSTRTDDESKRILENQYDPARKMLQAGLDLKRTG